MKASLFCRIGHVNEVYHYHHSEHQLYRTKYGSRLALDLDGWREDRLDTLPSSRTCILLGVLKSSRQGCVKYNKPG